MNSPDFTKRSNAIVILLGSEVFFFVAMFASYLMPHAPDDLRKICATAFTGATGMLALALKLGGPDTPNPPDPIAASTQTTTTTVTKGGTDVPA